ncbi:hypothetical protein [Azohydromonas lata]|uniref:Uncharacterized protein n=1 Tax=Azohydromonas lata TaxID=45677 RepID=A0ABU5INT5_9BURK|nr:hypothetical protein [Azohydromonas lata]MDZ5460529.1 hypothetical protein [Azohydromonas lata]
MVHDGCCQCQRCCHRPVHVLSLAAAREVCAGIGDHDSLVLGNKFIPQKTIGPKGIARAVAVSLAVVDARAQKGCHSLGKI